MLAKSRKLIMPVHGEAQWSDIILLIQCVNRDACVSPDLSGLQFLVKREVCLAHLPAYITPPFQLPTHPSISSF